MAIEKNTILFVMLQLKWWILCVNIVLCLNNWLPRDMAFERPRCRILFHWHCNLSRTLAHNVGHDKRVCLEERKKWETCYERWDLLFVRKLRELVNNLVSRAVCEQCILMERALNMYVPSITLLITQWNIYLCLIVDVGYTL